MANSIYEVILAIEKARPRAVAVLTGAGVSAESGIPTFRGAGGLWEGLRPEELATPSAFERNPLQIWRWYEWRRNLIRAALPNEAHRALAALARISAVQLTLITQNVDGLHGRAGSDDVVELHGNLFRARCVREGTVVPAEEAFALLPPRCGCGSLLRPDVVWFGEALDPQHLEIAADAVAGAELLLVVGTSGVVQPAAGLVSLFRGSLSVEVNPVASAISPLLNFALELPAAQALPLLVHAISRGLK
ncbi:MAG TPA: NAD-dependent protein deacylase [Thermoanaerobaculia bacterium]|nr:NAD-dependent protein deacylase [Thermoanaerobaculia bacterium]